MVAVLFAFALLAPPDKTKLEEKIDAVVRAALDRNDMPGAVVLILHRDAILLRKAYGSRSLRPEKMPMTADAVFDLASLTKPVATAASVWKLVEQGKIAVTDPVSKHLVAFGHEEITIEQLLTHTSGLPAGTPVADYANGPEKIIARIAALKLAAKPGEKFVYSDVGFIVLGELVAKVSGKSVAEFAKKELFAPLKMVDTGFRPEAMLSVRIAPTTKLGVVHDPRAAAMDGVAGHAGLFGTADDLGRFARALLHDGELEGVRIFKAETVKAFLEPVNVTGGSRSRGWDVDTAFSGPRGDGFAKGTGFGHTGFTGTSIWVDPKSQTIVILLTNRVHPDDKGNVTKLRREIGTIVGEAVK